MTDEAEKEKKEISEKVKEVATDVKNKVEEKVEEAKEAVKQGVDKISTDRDVAIIALVSSVISSLVVGVVLSFFFTRKNKQSFFSKKYVMKMIDKML